MTKKARPLSYVVVGNQPLGGIARTVARVTCAQCGARGETVVMRSNNPDLVAGKFREEGWQFDKNTARLCICPACVAARSQRRQGEAPGPKPPAPVLPFVTPAPAIPAVEEISMPPSDDTRAAKKRVRELLDHHFDAEAGAFAEGWTDDRIAETTGMAAVFVAGFRDEFYGPIRVDPEVEAVRAELKALTAMIAAAEDGVKRLTADVASLRAVAAEIERRLAAGRRAA